MNNWRVYDQMHPLERAGIPLARGGENVAA
jgi:hypothetical protein